MYITILLTVNLCNDFQVCPWVHDPATSAVVSVSPNFVFCFFSEKPNPFFQACYRKQQIKFIWPQREEIKTYLRQYHTLTIRPQHMTL